MNEALERYENNEDVFSICGFWPPKPAPGDDSAFFLNYFAGWGWATWKRAWDFFDYNAAGWEMLLKNKRLAWDFDLEGRFDFTAMLLSQVKNNTTWDIQWNWIVYREKKLCLFPPRSLTTNIGFDAEGSHTLSSEDGWLVRDIDLTLGDKIALPAQCELSRSKRFVLGELYYLYIKKRRGLSLRGLFWTFYRFLRRVFLIIPYGIEIRNNIRF
jgi:hypothetical protein